METQQILSPFTVTYLKSGIHAVAKMVRFLFVPRKSFLQWYGSFKTRILFYFKISALISLVVAFSHTNIYGKTTFDKRFLRVSVFSHKLVITTVYREFLQRTLLAWFTCRIFFQYNCIPDGCNRCLASL